MGLNFSIFLRAIWLVWPHQKHGLFFFLTLKTPWLLNWWLENFLFKAFTGKSEKLNWLLCFLLKLMAGYIKASVNQQVMLCCCTRWLCCENSFSGLCCLEVWSAIQTAVKLARNLLPLPQCFLFVAQIFMYSEYIAYLDKQSTPSHPLPVSTWYSISITAVPKQVGLGWRGAGGEGKEPPCQTITMSTAKSSLAGGGRGIFWQMVVTNSTQLRRGSESYTQCTQRWRNKLPETKTISSWRSQEGQSGRQDQKETARKAKE